MSLIPKRLAVAVVVLFALSALSSATEVAASTPGPPLRNWSAPATYVPAASQSRVRALNDISSPVPFIAIAPCRQYNSLLASPLLQGVNRNVTLTNAPCNIPTGAVAVSVNITVFNITGATGNGVFKVDTVSPPAVAWINYPPSEAQRGNAGVVALNVSGQIVVQVAQGAGQVDFVVDVNGYYASVAANQFNPFYVKSAGDYAILGVNVGTSFGATAVLGEALSNGANYGVRGYTLSFNDGAAGVFGNAYLRPNTLATYGPAGIRGEATVAGSYGVLGIASSGSGVGASLVDPSGTQLAYALLAAGGSPNYAVYAGGNYGGTGAKYFVEPHPTDAAKVIRYISLEGPEAGTYFRGRGKFQNGLATIEVPEDFRMVTDSEGLSIQVTPIGGMAMVSVVHIGLDGIAVEASRNVDFFYTVNGVRKTHKDLKPIGPGDEYMPRDADARMPAFLTAGQKAMLIANGTYNEDGTVNLHTAERVGWTRVWADREAERQAAVKRNSPPVRVDEPPSL